VTPTNASLGSLDPARLSRLDASGRLASGDAADQGSAAAYGALSDAQQRPRGRASAFDAFWVALSMLPEIDPRAALPPMTAYYLMKCGATALVPYYQAGRSGGGRRHQGSGPANNSSVLLANHGPVVSCESLEAARISRIEELEETGKTAILLSAPG